MSGKAVLVSACLLGENCKYSGGNNRCEAVVRFARGKDVIPVCPEVEAGLPVPRPPVEIRNRRVVRQDGTDLTAVYREGAARVLARTSAASISCAILKARSPTCGVHEIYDGTFTGKRIPGRGLFAEALAARGIPVYDEEDVEKGAMMTEDEKVKGADKTC